MKHNYTIDENAIMTIVHEDGSPCMTLGPWISVEDAQLWARNGVPDDLCVKEERNEDSF